jgi:hypothetical protein
MVERLGAFTEMEWLSDASAVISWDEEDEQLLFGSPRTRVERAQEQGSRETMSRVQRMGSTPASEEAIDLDVSVISKNGPVRSRKEEGGCDEAVVPKVGRGRPRLTEVEKRNRQMEKDRRPKRPRGRPRKVVSAMVESHESDRRHVNEDSSPVEISREVFEAVNVREAPAFDQIRSPVRFSDAPHLHRRIPSFEELREPPLRQRQVLGQVHRSAFTDYRNALDDEMIARRQPVRLESIDLDTNRSVHVTVAKNNALVEQGKRQLTRKSLSPITLKDTGIACPGRQPRTILANHSSERMSASFKAGGRKSVRGTKRSCLSDISSSPELEIQEPRKKKVRHEREILTATNYDYDGDDNNCNAKRLCKSIEVPFDKFGILGAANQAGNRHNDEPGTRRGFMDEEIKKTKVTAPIPMMRRGKRCSPPVNDVERRKLAQMDLAEFKRMEYIYNADTRKRDPAYRGWAIRRSFFLSYYCEFQ